MKKIIIILCLFASVAFADQGFKSFVVLLNSASINQPIDVTPFRAPEILIQNPLGNPSIFVGGSDVDLANGIEIVPRGHFIAIRNNEKG